MICLSPSILSQAQVLSKAPDCAASQIYPSKSSLSTYPIRYRKNGSAVCPKLIVAERDAADQSAMISLLTWFLDSQPWVLLLAPRLHNRFEACCLTHIVSGSVRWDMRPIQSWFIHIFPWLVKLQHCRIGRGCFEPLSNCIYSSLDTTYWLRKTMDHQNYMC